MCTYQTEKLAVSGSGKGPDGWFPLSSATVYFDHPAHYPAEHSLNIDFLNLGDGASFQSRSGARPGLGTGAGTSDPGDA